jgi:hypothetical protein
MNGGRRDQATALPVKLRSVHSRDDAPVSQPENGENETPRGLQL